MLAALIEQKQQELASAIARMYDEAIAGAMKANGWPIDAKYFMTHVRVQAFPDGDLVYHDGTAFLRLIRSFDYSDLSKIRVTITSKPVNNG